MIDLERAIGVAISQALRRGNIPVAQAFDRFLGREFRGVPVFMLSKKLEELVHG